MIKNLISVAYVGVVSKKYAVNGFYNNRRIQKYQSPGKTGATGQGLCPWNPLGEMISPRPPQRGMGNLKVELFFIRAYSHYRIFVLRQGRRACYEGV